MRSLAWIAALVVPTGCATSLADDVVGHVLTIDGNGVLLDPKSHEKLEGPVSKESPRALHVDTTGRPTNPRCEQDVWFDRVLDRMIETTQPLVNHGEPRRVMVFVHGGLNTFSQSAETANFVIPQVHVEKGDPYPIFVQWDSGGFTSIFDDWTLVRQGREPDSLFWMLASPLFLLRDLVTGIAKTPIDVCYELENDLGTAPASSEAADRRYCNYRSLPVAGDPDAPNRIGHGGDFRSAGVKTVDWTSKFLTLPLRLVGMPLVAGAGPSAWEDMRRRTSMLYRTEDELKSSSTHVFSSGPLSRFMRRLQSEIEARSSGGHEKWEITLVGHSMGSFAVNQMLRDFPKLPVTRIVYLAAACSIRDYQNAAIPFLKRNLGTTVQHVVLETNAEEQEQYHIPYVPYLEVAPRGTLLVWIDMYLSKPDTLLDRTAGRYVNLVLADGLIDTLEDDAGRPLRRRVTVKQFDRGTNSPQKHGEMDSIAFWRLPETLPREFAVEPCRN